MNRQEESEGRIFHLNKEALEYKADIEFWTNEAQSEQAAKDSGYKAFCIDRTKRYELFLARATQSLDSEVKRATAKN